MITIGRRGSAILVAAALALSACDGGDATSPSPSVSGSSSPRLSLPLATGTAAPLTVGPALWSTSTKRLPGYETAVLSDGTAVLSGWKGVAALDTRTGRVLWSHDAAGATAALGDGKIRFSPYSLNSRDVVTPAVEGAGRLVLVGYVGEGNRDSVGVAALSLRTGRLVWTARLAEDFDDAPSIRVVGASGRHVLVSFTPNRGTLADTSVAGSSVLDAATGKVRWRRDHVVAWQLSGETAVLSDVTGTEIAADADSAAGPLVGWDAATAKQRWRVPNPSREGRVDSPTDRSVLVGGSHPTLIDTTNGRTLWRGSASTFCDSDGHRLLACQTGQRLVSWSTADPVVRMSSRPVDGLVRRVEDGRVYVSSPGAPDQVLDVSGRSLGALGQTGEVLAASGTFAIFTSAAEYDTGVISARPVRS